MNIRHVQFPCGRRGLELETWTAAVNGNDGEVTFSYFYNGFSYPTDLVRREGVPVVVDRSGRIGGLLILRTLDPRQVLMSASSDWM